MTLGESKGRIVDSTCAFSSTGSSTALKPFLPAASISASRFIPLAAKILRATSSCTQLAASSFGFASSRRYVFSLVFEFWTTDHP